MGVRVVVGEGGDSGCFIYLFIFLLLVWWCCGIFVVKGEQKVQVHLTR